MTKLIRSNNIYQSVLDIQQQGIAGALITVISTKGSTPRETGAKMIVKQNGEIIDTIGGGDIENIIIKDALEVIKTQKHKIVEYALEKHSKGEPTGMICGGSMKFFIENINLKPFLYIIGSGHVGRVMYELGILNQFNTTMIDNRKEYLQKEDFPDAIQFHYGDYPQTIQKVEFQSPAYVVIMTQSHELDRIVLEECLRKKTKYTYLAMIASKKKAHEIKENLKKRKIPQKRLDIVHSPAGLPIGSKRPSEIAVSIMAEIIKEKNSS